MNTFAHRLGDGAQEGEEGALAIRAGDMDDRRQLLLGMAKGREQTLDAPEREIDRLRVQLLQALEQRIA